MSRVLDPGSEYSCTIALADGGKHDVIVVDAITFKKPQKTRVAIDAAHTLSPRFVTKFMHGTLTCAFLTTEDLAWLPDVVGARMTMVGANGRQIIITDLTFAMDEGIEENTTDGKTNTLTFNFGNFSDSDIS